MLDERVQEMLAIEFEAIVELRTFLAWRQKIKAGTGAIRHAAAHNNDKSAEH